MKKHEILGELPKCATAMSKYYKRNGTNVLARHRVGHKPTTCKIVVYAKCSQVRYSYTSDSFSLRSQSDTHFHTSSFSCLLNSSSTFSD